MRLRPIASGAFVIAVLLVMIVGIAWAAGAAYEETPDKTEQRDEVNVTADVGNYTAVPALAPTQFYDNESFYDDGTELQEGTDYEWNSSDGTVKFLEGSQLVKDNETVTGEYAYKTKVQPAQGINSVASLLFELALPLSVLVAVATMIGGLAAALVQRGRRSTRNFGRR